MSTYEWHTDDIRVHTSDIWMIYEYIRVTYGWHTTHIQVIYRGHASTYEWDTNDIQVIYEYIRLTYKWYKKYYLRKRFGALRSLFLSICVKNTASCWCKRFLVTRWSLACKLLLMMYWVLGKFLPVNSSINIFRWNCDLMEFFDRGDNTALSIVRFYSFFKNFNFCIDLQFLLKDCKPFAMFLPLYPMWKLNHTAFLFAFFALSLSLSLYFPVSFSLSLLFFIILHDMLKCNMNFQKSLELNN